ncbi:YcdB/YcdC domain-containing protein [Tepidibacter thalassicus]|uniref:Peptidase propeptide and YPEB domain-containing protein n=1 Tax=Tepidibacter thalassicus DSM 15285 TaxID=1123350 RepID=A0A1M5S0Z1_9FIRM|nr:YcdB/YcdC domain-containing protein [Tepidibacter thalassicus]SHH32124.1 Peptidase propeptide and YPEB domain-containing protein [Tepidibacter thalassicus DSM 15285]
MIKNKFLGAFMAAAIVFGSLNPAFADLNNSVVAMHEQQKQVKISKEEARKIGMKEIKVLFGIDVSDFDENINFDSYMGICNWNIFWSKYIDEERIEFFVSVDSNTGKIRMLSKHENVNFDRNEKENAKIDLEKAKEIALDYIKQISPEKVNQIKLSDYDCFGNEYVFTYVRDIDGIEYDEDYITVDVDAVNGKMIGYYYTWLDNINFPKVDNIISKEEAEKLFDENIEVYLNYKSSFDSKTNKEKAMLVYNYRFKNSDMIDAKEGKFISWGGQSKEKEETRDIDESKKEEIFKNAKHSSKLEKNLTREEAVELIDKIIKELYNVDVELNNVQYLRDNYINSDGIWMADFVEKGNDKYVGNVIISALTGKLMNISMWDNDEKDEAFTPKLTWDEAYEKAIEAISEFFPEKIKDIKTEQIKYPLTYKFEGKEIQKRNIYFNFPRIVNGVEYYDNNIVIVVDMKTGQIRELDCFWNDKIEFEDIDNIISKEDAKKIFFKENKPKLKYINLNTDNDNLKYETKLIYMFTPVDLSKSVFDEINAHTGKATNF